MFNLFEINEGMLLYRMDYHLTGEVYKVKKYDDSDRMGELEAVERPGSRYVFNDYTIKEGALFKSPEDALKGYKHFEDKVQIKPVRFDV